MAAWSTAFSCGSRRRLRVGGDEVQARLDGVVLGKGLDEPEDGEDAESWFSSSERSSAMSSGQQSTMPARSPSSPRWVEQLAQLLGRRGFTAYPPSISVSASTDRVRTVDPVAAATQLVGDAAPTPEASANTSQDDPPRRVRLQVRRSRRASRPTEFRRGPCRFARVTCATRHSATAPVKPSKTASGSPARSLIVMSHSICFGGGRHDATRTVMCSSGGP